MQERGELKFVSEDTGELYAMIHGILMMLRLYVDSLDVLHRVRILYKIRYVVYLYACMQVLLLIQVLPLELEMALFCLIMFVAVEQSQLSWSVLTGELVFMIVALMKMLV